MRKLFLLTSVLILLPACAKPSNPSPVQPRAAEPERSDAVYLTPVQHLIRVSIDLRGVRPTLDEINDVEAHPDKVRSYIRAYMNDPRFAERVMDIWNENYLTRIDKPFFPGPPELQGYLTNDDFARANGYEPLQMIANVVTKDRPWTEIVTGQYTMANNVLADYYDITRPNGAGPGWTESHYSDGRPEAGVLSSTAFFSRWRTTDSNHNRGRANAVSRAVLCYDFMSRDIIVDTAINLADPNVVNNAVRTNASCAGCHQTLDPLASYFYGYFIPQELPMNAVFSYPIKTYSMDLEGRWQQETGRAPGYFGEMPGDRFDDLASAMSQDPRMTLCAVKRFEAAYTGRYMSDVTGDYDEIARLHDYFSRDKFDAKDLIEEIMMSPQYRVAGPKPGYTTAADVVGLKLIAPEQLDTTLADLTGFQWKLPAPEGYDLLQNDIYGFRDMAGGYDSQYVTAPAHTVNATHILTLRMAGADAAGLVVDKELAEAKGSRRLLTKIDATDTTETAVKSQAAALYRELYGMTVADESPETDDVWTLWSAAYANHGNDTAAAWKVTLAALFSDVKIAFY